MDPELLILPTHRPHRSDDIVGVGDGTGRHKPVGMPLERQTRGLIGHPDEAFRDAVAIHLMQRHRDRVVRRQVFGDLFEHVFHWELELFAGFAVFCLLADEVVLVEALVRKTDHGVDYGQPNRASHGILRSLAVLRTMVDPRRR
jgi:hypothetical protein